MTSAVRADTGRTVRATAVDSSAKPFACVSCNVPVERVNGYWTHREDPELARWIEPFFRLPRGEAHQHADRCKYTPAGQVAALVAEAEAVEDSIAPFEHLRPGGPVVFRLNIPAEEEQREKAAEPPKLTTNFKTRMERVWSGRRLDAYCRSAVGLARIWQELEGLEAQADLRRRVLIRHAGQDVAWPDFFFTPERMEHFANKAERREFRHPAALLLHTRSLRQDAEGRPVAVRFTPVPVADNLAETRIAVEAFGGERVLSRFEAKRHYIVFGEYWHRRTRPWSPPDGAVTITYRNFAVKLFQPSQVAEVQIVDPTGESSG